MRSCSALLIFTLVGASCGDRVAEAPAESRTQERLALADATAVQPEFGADPILEPQDARAPVENIVSQEATDSGDATSSRIFGRTVDGRGVAIAGVDVRLAAVGEPWSEVEGEGPGLYRASTSENGRFEFVTPVPTASWVSLVVTPSEFNAQAYRSFGEAGGRNSEPLRAGDNDLGDLVLAAAGSLRGVVTDSTGAPVVGAQVTTADRLPSEVSQNATTDQAGAFVLGHLPETQISVQAQAAGYAGGTSGRIHVVAGKRGGPVHVELQSAPVVSGRVEDEEGRPVQGALVKGWPLSSGRNTSGVTGSDGSFLLRLPVVTSYRFSVTADGFISIGKPGGDPDVILEPDSMGVVLTLRRSPQSTFLIVDDLTGEPIESFGLRVRAKPDGTWLDTIDREPIPVENHAGGGVKVDADPARHLIQVQAPGYAPLSADFGDDPARRGVHELRMVKGSAVLGTARLRGVPVAQPVARLTPAYIKFDPTLPDEEDTFFSDNYGTDLDAYTGRARRVLGDAQGRFTIVDLAAGTYTLVVRAPGAAPWTLSPLRVERADTVDLGTIDLRPGAMVRGRLLVAPGQSVAGARVILDGPFDEESVVVQADGFFEFTDLSEGSHILAVERTPGVRSSRLEVPFTVAEGEVLVQDIDLTQ